MVKEKKGKVCFFALSLGVLAEKTFSLYLPRRRCALG
jgi:hypothetical protein